MASSINASTTSGIVQTADTSGILNLQTANTTAVTIDASQNVGIGTASPAKKFQITESTYAQMRMNPNSAYGSIIEFVDSAAVTNGQIIAWGSTNATPNALSFNTGTTERMRIDASGNLLVGTTSAANGASTFSTAANSVRWSFLNTNNASGNYGLIVTYQNSTPNGTGNEFLVCNDPGATRMTVRSNGGIANYQANNVNLSDRREKTNFAPASSYLDKICAIPVQTFNYIDQNLETDDGLTLGVVAQDVQAVAPELVDESNWGTEENPKMRLSIYQTDLQYALMKCIQEQQALITSLTARLEVLENK